ncbi:MAG: hypothetical protein Q8906_13090 [Bacillota bacterium]|nr:hypothetical protein [Bacillota bacterium]
MGFLWEVVEKWVLELQTRVNGNEKWVFAVETWVKCSETWVNPKIPIIIFISYGNQD